MQSKEYLNQLYADVIRQVYLQYPDNADVSALYADTLMVQHPWDLYDRWGKPKAWTPQIVETLEKLLKKYPEHPGAVHYYIHAIEASDHPEKALSVASKLPELMPGVSHVVHMPSHIYIRSGYYNEGVKVNQQAVKSYEIYRKAFSSVVNNTPLYIIHNLHMEAACANMDGRYAAALKASEETRNSFDTAWQSFPDYFGIAVQYTFMTPFITQIRFGKWDDIIASPEQPEEHVYANLLWHYGRGMAYARKHGFTNANKELSALQKDMKDDQLKAPSPPYANPGIAGAGVAEKILEATIAEEQNGVATAFEILRKAVKREDAMTYNEPRDWQQPTRQYLGNVY